VARIRFILASASPARLATLRAAGIEPEVVVSGFDEQSSVQATTALTVASLAHGKATTVRERVSGPALVLGCDSLLDLDGEQLGKPGSYEVAVARWKQMRGRSGTLWTGHHLSDGAKSRSEAVGTPVSFAELSDDEIAAYCATGEPQNVAGAFTLDGYGGWFVDAAGDPHNVVGVSLRAVRNMLISMDYTLADLGYPRA
jgi:septum formation protein